MDLLDEMGTMAANGYMMNAIKEETIVNIVLPPLEEHLDKKVKLAKEFSMKDAMKADTCLFFYFGKFLIDQRHGTFRDFVEALGPYKTASTNLRKTLAPQIFKEHFVVGEKSSSVAPEEGALIPGQVGGEEKEKEAMRESKRASRASLRSSKRGSNKSKTQPVFFAEWVNKSHAECVAKLEADMVQGSGDLWNSVLTKLEAYFTKGFTESFLQSEHFLSSVRAKAYAMTELKYEGFRLFRVLGKGAFGAVSVAQKIDTGKVFAMKEMDKKMIKHDKCEQMVNNEKKILSKMSSPFVLKLDYSFHNKTSCFLLFEMLSGGDIAFHLSEAWKNGDSYFDNDRARFYSAEVILGLHNMHEQSIVYRDLKPANVLINGDGHVVISDLGLATVLDPNKLKKSQAGTPGYWAVEIAEQSGTYFVSDFWSLGVMLWEMIMGEMPSVETGDGEWSPFNGDDRIKGKDPSLKLEYPDEFSATCKDFLKKVFEPDPTKRIGFNNIQEIKEHPWFDGLDWEALASRELDPPFKPQERTVNAGTLAETGHIDKGKYRKVELTPEDDAKYRHFTYVNEDTMETNLSKALAKMEEQKAAGITGPPPKAAASGCCTIL